MKFVRIYYRCLSILWSGERRLTFTLIAMSIMVGFIQALEPVFFGNVIDALSRQKDVYHLLLLWAGLGIINIAASVFVAVMSDRLSHRQRLRTLDQVFERVIALPVSYHSSQGSGRVVHAILTGTDQLFNLWIAFMREHLSSVMGICLLVPIAMTMDGRMAAMLFVLSMVYVVANFIIVKKTQVGQERAEIYHQNLFSRIGDVIGNVNIVQSYTRLLEEIRGLQNIASQLLTVQYPVLTWWGILAVITRLSATLTLVAILAYGSILVSRGDISVGQVVSFAAFSGLLIGKLDQISSFISRTIARAPALQSFFSLLDQPGSAQEVAHAKPIAVPHGEVEFHQVTYRHHNSSRGIFDVSFKALAGQTIALVGPSGSGKTTTLALLQRLFDPQEGEIKIDGEDIRGATTASLRQAIAVVFQDAGLFNRSISENIRVGRPSASDADVMKAAEQAAAHDFIQAKPGGYDFVIGERGMALSGGERQRVAIARAILKDAPILVFDEATSALDTQTEKKIQAAIGNLRVQEKTTFIIAHRLSTVISADQILVFDNGHIVEAGTFKELKNQNGLFSNLVKMGELATDNPIEAPHAAQ